MTNSRMALLLGFVLTAGFTIARLAQAEAPIKEKVAEAAKGVKKTVKKGMRDASDATCPMVDGKIKCAGKKLKHKAEDAAEKAE